MKCPVCKDATLLMTEKQGVEVDYCPECRGIWLDRGELEKIIEKSENNTFSNVAHQETKEKPVGKKRKKESVLSEIFEMFGE